MNSPPVMRAITLHRPWPWAIFSLDKCVENRSWKPPADLIGQRIAIHAGRRFDDAGAGFIIGLGHRVAGISKALDQGIIGTATVVGVIKRAERDSSHVIGRMALLAGSWGQVSPKSASRWFVGDYGWLLDDRRALPEPIPCKGAQGVWRLPAETADRLNAEVRRV